MRILVTGATGFIGGHLVRYLLNEGHRVRALVRRECPVLAALGAELAYGDVTDAEAMRTAVEGVDAIFHLAAVRDRWGTPETVYQQVNVEGTRRLLEAAAEAQIQHVVHCSSVGVARYPGDLQADETLPYSKSTSQVFYHRTKAQAERIAIAAQAVVVRPVITYGPRDENGFMTRLITLLAQGQFFWVGDGRNHVDLVYIDDLVLGMYTALVQGTAGRVYILSGTAPIRVQTLIDKICKQVGQPTPHVHIPASFARMAGWGLEMLWETGDRLGIEMDSKEPFITRDKVATLTVNRGFSHARAQRELGYHPQVTYDEGIWRTLAWLQDRK